MEKVTMEFEVILSGGQFIRFTAADGGTLVELFNQHDGLLLADGFMNQSEAEHAIQVIKSE